MPEAIRKAISEFIASARDKASDGLTWAEFGSIYIEFIRLQIFLFDGVVSMTGAEKKAAVLEGVASLFDALSPFLLPWWLRPASGALRSLVVALASGAIENLLPLVRGKR